MGSSIQYWNVVPGSNQASDPDIFSADSQSPSTVDDNIRSLMAATAKYSDDTDGKLTAGGTPNALTVTTYQVLVSAQLTSGLMLRVKAISANTSATVTFAPDGLTAAPIKRADGSALAVGSIQAGVYLSLVYNQPTSEWWADNIPPPILGVTDNSAAAAGQVGEYQTNNGGPQALINALPATCGIGATLNPGDWDVWGVIAVTASGANITATIGNIATVGGNLGSPITQWSLLSTATFSAVTMVLPMQRFSSASPFTVYANCQVNFVSGTCNVTNWALYARRVR